MISISSGTCLQKWWVRNGLWSVGDFYLSYFSAVLSITFLINALTALKGSQFYF